MAKTASKASTAQKTKTRTYARAATPRQATAVARRKRADGSDIPMEIRIPLDSGIAAGSQPAKPLPTRSRAKLAGRAGPAKGLTDQTPA